MSTDERSKRLERLDDYVTGELADGDATAFEEEMFAAIGADAEVEGDVRFFDRVSRILTAFVAHGAFSGPSTEKDIERLRAAGAIVHVVELPAEGGTFELEPWPSNAQVIVICNRVDVRGYEEVEVEVENADGSPVKTFRGVECDPATGNIFAVCAAPLARMAYATKRRISRVTGVRDGMRRIITVFDTTPRA